MDAAGIEKEALNLSETERALLADRLLQTIGGEDELRLEAWATESEQRLRAVREGRLNADDGETVAERLRVRVL